MTDHLTENARLRAALEQIVALNIAASLPWTHEQAADNYWRMIDSMKGIARAALATPAPDAPVDWLWYGEDADGKMHVSFGRWQRHPCQSRYKLADIQPVEHDHTSPAPDAVQEATRVLLDAEGRAHPKLVEIAEEQWDAGSSMSRCIGVALRAIAGDRT